MLKLKAGSAAALSVALAAWSMSPGIAATVTGSSAPVRTDRATQRDFNKLSVAGAKAFDDVVLARLAIFDGHPATATTLIQQAQAGFDLAANDKTTFNKAENALQPPSSMHQPAPVASDGGSAPIT